MKQGPLTDFIARNGIHAAARKRTHDLTTLPPRDNGKENGNYYLWFSSPPKKSGFIGLLITPAQKLVEFCTLIYQTIL